LKEEKANLIHVSLTPSFTIIDQGCKPRSQSSLETPSYTFFHTLEIIVVKEQALSGQTGSGISRDLLDSAPALT
jgi:hypothetical protein